MEEAAKKNQKANQKKIQQAVANGEEEEVKQKAPK